MHQAFPDEEKPEVQVGWSDLALFAIFESGHIAADEIYFYWFNSENRQLCACAHAKVIFFKSQPP